MLFADDTVGVADSENLCQIVIEFGSVASTYEPFFIKNFKDFCTNFINMIYRMSGNAQRIDYVFGTYLPESV